MESNDYISLVGAVVTIVSMIVTIIYANKAKSYKKQIQQDVRKINLSNVVDILKKAQEEIRELPKSFPPRRGIKINIIIVSIKTHFDNSLNILDSDGPEKKIRNFISEAQSSLMNYENKLLIKECNPDMVSLMTEHLQEAISKAHTKILALEKDL